MTEQAFWDLIAQAREISEDNTDSQVWEIEELLLQKKPEEAVAFVKHLQRLLANSFQPNLWEACYLINLDDREDTFEFFRAWLIMLGKETFDLINENPDAIIDFIDEKEVNEDFRLSSPELLSLGFSVWEELTGNSPEEMPIDRIEVEMEGEPNFEDSYLSEEYPLLWEMFG